MIISLFVSNICPNEIFVDLCGPDLIQSGHVLLLLLLFNFIATNILPRLNVTLIPRVKAISSKAN